MPITYDATEHVLFKEGRIEGKKEGILEGEQKGLEKALKKAVLIAIRNTNLSDLEIAQELEVSVGFVEEIRRNAHA